MKNENDMPEWKFVVPVVVIIVVVIAVANLLDIRLRSAKYLVYAILCLGLYFVSVVRNKKK